MQSTLSFHGAAGAVTGSNFLLDTGGSKVLVDCGLKQGLEEAHNWEAFQYNPSSVYALVVTHAHLDHIGRIPKLVKDGFRGVIISTEATRAIAEPILEDALELLERSAEHHGRPPLYAKSDITEAFKLWKGVPYHEPQELKDGVRMEFLDAGHILGSAMAKFTRGAESIVFTGDIGGGNSPLLGQCEKISGAKYLVMESTYGDRARPDDSDRLNQLEDVIEDSAARGGTLLIPAFSTERSQDLLFDIRRLMQEKKVPSMPVYLDSPLAEEVTSAYEAFPDYFSADIQKRLKSGEHIFSFHELQYVKSQEDSRALNNRRGPKIILAGSGMLSGGRVVNHEQEILPDQKSTILIVGYQALGTTGRKLSEGEKEIELYHKKVPVRAKIDMIFGYSAHKDSEALLEFANQAQSTGTREVFLTHGEPASAMFLAQRIRDYLGMKVSVPEEGEQVMLDF